MTTVLPRRTAVATEHTWKLEDIFASVAAWETAYQEVTAALPQLEAFAGRLGESAAILWEWFRAYEQVAALEQRVSAYARLWFDSDTANQQAVALVNRAQSLSARVEAAIAFVEPELLSLAPTWIAQCMEQEPALKLYAHFFAELDRRRAHVRSAEVEQVLAQVEEPLGTPLLTYQMLSDGDLKFRDAVDTAERSHQVAQGTIEALLRSSDRRLRQTAWESYADGFLGVGQTLAALMMGNVQRSVFLARAQRYASSLERALFATNVPTSVYENVLAACRRHQPIWHRYWDIRRRALGMSRLDVYDIFAPLSEDIPVPYEQAVEWISNGMAPLGSEYVGAARAGMTNERWVDIYPNEGKRSGAYSIGVYTTHPYILMSYTNDLESLSTLAHELGHAMHSYFSNRTQPYIYSHYTIFAAEVASNFNQALTRAYLLRQNESTTFQIAVIEEAMRNFHRYLFLMPILAQFELTIHQQVERHEPLTSDGMSSLLVELFRQGYGPAVHLDEARVGITWAQFIHLYAPFYVYQYASGIAAANALADRVLQGEEGIVERYLEFLKAGGYRYPLDALAQAGVDMAQPEPMDQAFRVLEQFVDRLDQLV